jgi:GNAT superfamily N-acetyltransferase
MDTTHCGGMIVTLEAGNRGPFLEHLLRLDPVARQQRFWHPASDADVSAYVGRTDMERVKIIGYMAAGALCGAVELIPAGGKRGRVLDAAVSVEQAWQERGIATLLLLRAIAVARGLGASHVRVGGLAENPRLRSAVAQFDVDMHFDDEDCQAWVPVGRMDEAEIRHEPAAAVP